MPANPFIATGDELWYDTGSTWRQRRRAWFDGVAVPLVDLGGARAMRWLHWAATTWARTGLEPPTGCDIAALFPDVAPRAAGAIARRSSALLAKNRAAIALVERRGLQALARFVSPASSTSPFDPRGRTGLVIAGFHVGAHFGLGAALARW